VVLTDWQGGFICGWLSLAVLAAIVKEARRG
jgi:hypothetical protein